jgi:hypothetical protein
MFPAAESGPVWAKAGAAQKSAMAVAPPRANFFIAISVAAAHPFKKRRRRHFGSALEKRLIVRSCAGNAAAAPQKRPQSAESKQLGQGFTPLPGIA